METKIKTRFCPSPTGLMHLGNLRTALFNALLAKKQKGIFLLRIEDTDKVRSERKYADILMADLRRLGLDWQEGPEVEGPAKPYWQSLRQPLYDQFYHHLEAEGMAYPCFCTEEQLALNRKIQRSAGKPPRYSGACQSLTPEEIDAKIADGLKPTLRFRIPKGHEIVFHDLVRGEQRFKSDDIGDFIIRRADGTSPFMFCSAIDDALMEVTHILRGEDHLANTPRQLMILRALGLKESEYGHISLIMGSDGAPLSKRNGSRSLQELCDEGFLPLAIVNYLARLGHHYTNENLMSLDELAKHFSLETLGHSAAKFNFDQLLYWQKQAVNNISHDEFWNWIGGSVKKIVPKKQTVIFFNTVKLNVVFPDDVAKWARIFYAEEFKYSEESKGILKDAGVLFFETAMAVVKKHGIDYQTVTSAISEKLSIKGKALFMPLRIALTGEKHGPELKNIFEILGKGKLQTRLQLSREIFR